MGKAVNGMAVIDTFGWATLFVAGWWLVWRGSRKQNVLELMPESSPVPPQTPTCFSFHPKEKIMHPDEEFHKKLANQLIKHEGLRLTPYRCPAGRLTIGIGRNLEDKGITEKEAVMLLKNDIQECIENLKTIF